MAKEIVASWRIAMACKIATYYTAEKGVIWANCGVVKEQSA